ncbi:MAG: 16S rRNA (cytidine(1402)-2'-O)-methyltransferase [bacterium]|nr:16S rRNA (cytidine(1402)-2'-O)-methyltransferase [bacterium]
MTEETAGTLYVVATPIGNLADISPRAIDTLKLVDTILCEDTRHSSKLLQHFAITTPLKSYHDHNEQQRTSEVIESLVSGRRSLALISDAGTPTISDPGYRIVRACRQAGVKVITIPGPSAAIAALAISGLPTDRFIFEGFVPQKSGRRLSALSEALTSGYTVIFYESPFRIIKTLGTICEVNPQANVFVGRELSKKFEESWFGSAEQVASELDKKGSIKGEFVLIVNGRELD